MFAISREDMLAGLEHLEDEKLKYYDAHCPKCRRANRVDRHKLELAYPDWKTDIKTMAKQSAASSAEEKAAPAVKEKKAAAAPVVKAKPAPKKAAAPKDEKPAKSKAKAPAASAKKPAAAKKK